MKKWLTGLLLLPALLSANEDKKVLRAERLDSEKIRIDGNLSEQVWRDPTVPAAKNFVMLEPGDGEPIPDRFKTRVKIYFNDEAIYVGAMMYDNQPDSILTQLTERDDYSQNHDFFLFAINPFNDGLSDFNFVVTAAGVQADSRTTADGDAISWNSVWESAVSIHDSGWSVAMRIPYMALRFPEQQRTDWGLNMIRSIRRNRTQWSWNYIDRTSGYRWEYQSGLLTGIKDVEPPVRLSLMPYLSGYYDNFDGNTTWDGNGGLDLKYGISESFTLDMTLIPDFGQVALDEQFVNFSPFENRFDENRQFFTEGTELFSIGDIFYSRRIGGAPKNISNVDLNDSGVVDVQPEYTRLLNATKISGRTEGNLGVGFLNAITDNSYTTFTDEDGTKRRELTEPLTNYNMIVLDQRINRNSSVSFINTNVLRNGAAYDANVAGLLTSINFNQANYRFDGSIKRSDKIYTDETISGYESRLRIGDVKGNWLWAVRQDITDDNYDPNDLGFQRRGNFWKYYGELEYRILQPHGNLNRTSYTLYGVHQSLFEPRRFETFYLGFRPFWLDRNFNGFGGRIVYHPVKTYNYFEPRTSGRYFTEYPRYRLQAFVSTDYRKVLALDARVQYEHWQELLRDWYLVRLAPRLRLGDRLFSIFTFQYEKGSNDYGYARDECDDILFGRRHRHRTSSSVDLRCVFDNTKILNLTARYLWDGLDYQQMYLLEENGELTASQAAMQENLNFNTITMDLKFSWWYAPGSEMVLLYRYVVAANTDQFENNYLNNFGDALASPAQNVFSIRLTYFLDYNQVKHLF